MSLNIISLGTTSIGAPVDNYLILDEVFRDLFIIIYFNYEFFTIYNNSLITTSFYLFSFHAYVHVFSNSYDAFWFL